MDHDENSLYLAWRITYQSSEQAARAAFLEIMRLKNRRSAHAIEEIIVMKIVFILFSLMFIAGAASAEPSCERIGNWYRVCAPDTGQNYQQALENDCKQTIRRILARPGASWNSEWNWAPEEACQAYWPRTQADFVRLYQD